MSNIIDNVKFDISSNHNTNAATSIMNNGFIPAGPAVKNGWEEVTSVTDNIKMAVAGLYSSVMEVARDALNLGGGESEIVVNVYKSVPQDLQITVASLQEIDKRFSNKTGFFKSDNETVLAQQIILDYTAVFDKVRTLTSSMIVELQDVLLTLHNKAKQQSDLINPDVISDVEVKTA